MLYKNTIIAVIAVITAFSSITLQAGNHEGAQKYKKSPPFLITGKLPHLTMMVKKQWDNPKFNLSDEQKNKLLKVRKETMSNAKRLGKEINTYESEVRKRILNDEPPMALKSLVRTIAQLKSEATMVHLACIHNTRKILTSDQIRLLIRS